MITELQDYLNEVEEERKAQGLKIRDVSEMAFGSPARYSYVLYTKGNVGVKALKSLAEVLGKKLVICLVDGEDFSEDS